MTLMRAVVPQCTTAVGKTKVQTEIAIALVRAKRNIRTLLKNLLLREEEVQLLIIRAISIFSLHQQNFANFFQYTFHCTDSRKFAQIC